jgi:hypothetical protein
VQNVMSALHPKADMCSAPAHVRFVPIADIDLWCSDVGLCRKQNPEVVGEIELSDQSCRN